MTRFKSSQGSSSLEIMAALVLFLLVAAGLAIALPMAYERADVWRDQTILARSLEKQGEIIRGISFSDLEVGDSGWLTDGDVQYKTVTTIVKPGTDSGNRPTWVPQSNRSGDGLAAVYYDNQDLTGDAFFRTDPAVNFNWGNGSPHSTIDNNTFSARWTGFIETNSAGTYTFFVDADEAFRLWVNQQLVMDYWINPSNREVSASITLAANTIYPIRMEYYDANGPASAYLRWSGPSIVKGIIPQSNLYSGLTKMTLITVVNSDGSRSLNGRLLTFDNGSEDTTPPTHRLHIAEIIMIRTYNGINWRAWAIVLVRDELNRNVGSATVTGTWSGLATGVSSGTTWGTGLASLASSRTHSRGSITFTVTNITKSGYTYDPAANAVTSSSTTGP